MTDAAPNTAPPHRPRAGRRRRLPLILMVIAVGGACGLFWHSYVRAPATSTLMTALAAPGDIEETVLATGILKPVKLVAVGAQVSGRVTSVTVALGDRVAKGTLVAEIDSITQENALRTARAALANVHAQHAEKEASLVLAEQTLARQRNMVAQKAVSQ
ncbi:MAG: hypothetical protein B7Z15_09140, partial [Rhizobiales bacterium 32-66-8]